MRKLYAALGAVAMAATSFGALATPAGAAPPPGDADTISTKDVRDELLSPLEVKRRALRAEAM